MPRVQCGKSGRVQWALNGISTLAQAAFVDVVVGVVGVAVAVDFITFCCCSLLQLIDERPKKKVK